MKYANGERVIIIGYSKDEEAVVISTWEGGKVHVTIAGGFSCAFDNDHIILKSIYNSPLYQALK